MRIFDAGRDVRTIGRLMSWPPHANVREARVRALATLGVDRNALAIAAKSEAR